MKKFLFLSMAMIMAILSLGLTACGDDDKDEPSGANADLVGTWKMTGSEDGFSYISLVQFTKDGKFYNVEVSEYNGEVETDISRGTYTVKGDVITITAKDDGYDEVDTYSVKYQIKGKQLIVSEGGYSMTYSQAKNSEIEKYL